MNSIEIQMESGTRLTRLESELSNLLYRLDRCESDESYSWLLARETSLRQEIEREEKCFREYSLLLDHYRKSVMTIN